MARVGFRRHLRCLLVLLASLAVSAPVAQVRAAKAGQVPSLVVVVDRTELGEEEFTNKIGRHALPGRADDVAVDQRGNLFIADNYVGAKDVRCQVRERLVTTGAVRVIAGAIPGQIPGRTPAQRLALSSCKYLAVNAGDDVYVMFTHYPYARYPLQLFRINALSGAVSAVAGCLRCYGFRPGRPATQSSVSSVSGLAVDRSGNVLLAEATTGAIWRLTSAGIVTRVATDVCRFPPHSFVCPQAIAPAKSGTIYFDGELDRRVVESLNPETGKITIVAGGGSCRVNRYFFCGNGVLATRAKLAGTGGIAVDSAGNLFLVDDGLVQRVDARTHRITILAGSGKLIGGPIQVRRGQSFPALTTTIEPQALAVARTGAILMSEEGSGAVLELRPGPAIRVSSPQHRVDRQPAAGDR